ncbi:MAG: transcriptional regulator, partial [Sulfitobacter sp.]|nr:transcriptional regulator [Sulfitobacter sp.]
MQTHKAKRVEITIEAVMESRLTDALKKAGVTGFTVLPVLGGSGRSG